MKLFRTVNAEIKTDCKTFFGIDSHKTNYAFRCEIQKYGQLHFQFIQLVVHGVSFGYLAIGRRDYF